MDQHWISISGWVQTERASKRFPEKSSKSDNKMRNDERVNTTTPNLAEGKDNVNPLDKQEGGDHYKRWVIQPVEFCHKNRLDWCQANVVKYVCRFRDKNGLEDLRKAQHYLELLIEFEYGANRESNGQT